MRRIRKRESEDGEERLELVVGDETPYRVLARLGRENTITTGGKFS